MQGQVRVRAVGVRSRQEAKITQTIYDVFAPSERFMIWPQIALIGHEGADTVNGRRPDDEPLARVAAPGDARVGQEPGQFVADLRE